MACPFVIVVIVAVEGLMRQWWATCGNIRSSALTQSPKGKLRFVKEQEKTRKSGNLLAMTTLWLMGGGRGLMVNVSDNCRENSVRTGNWGKEGEGWVCIAIVLDNCCEIVFLLFQKTFASTNRPPAQTRRGKALGNFDCTLEWTLAFLPVPRHLLF